MSTALTLLKILADGEVHSGTALGEAIGVSRAAVWKHLQQLQHYGIECRAVPGLGYQLCEPLDLLDPNLFATSALSHGEWHYFLELDSTNSFLLKKVLSAPQQVLIATTEYQTAGRGRRGRQWHSPFAANLYLSIKREFVCGLEGLSGLSLAIGVAVATALQTFCDTPVQLKWPNDIRAQQQKLGGILIELSGEAGGPCQVVIGIGINVHMQAEQAAKIDQAWISLDQIARQKIQRQPVLMAVVEQVLSTCQHFEQHGLSSFRAAFESRDEFRGKTVNIIGVNEVIEGVVIGIDDHGSLLLDTPTGQRKIIAGEVSLRQRV